jgi:hypothetical protein
VVLVIASSGAIVGVTSAMTELSRLRGPPALLLGKAKDNNASAASPFIRLFDASFTLDDAPLTSFCVEGPDGSCSTAILDGKISRDPADLAAEMIGPHHQYPDGALISARCAGEGSRRPGRVSPTMSAISSPSRRQNWVSSSTAWGFPPNCRPGNSAPAR